MFWPSLFLLLCWGASCLTAQEVNFDALVPSSAVFSTLSDGVTSAIKLAALSAEFNTSVTLHTTDGSGASALSALCTIGNVTFGLLGPYASEERLLLGALSSDYAGLPVLGYGVDFSATATSLHDLFSLQPSGSLQLEALVKLLLEMKVARDAAAQTTYTSPKELVAMLYTADSFGEGAALEFLSVVSDLGLGSQPVPAAAVQVVESVVLAVDDDSQWDGQLATAQASGARIIVLFAEALDGIVRRILSAADAAGMLGEGYQWVLFGEGASDAAFTVNSSYTDAKLAYAARGSLGLRPCPPGNDTTADAFASTWQSLDAAKYPGAGPTGLRADGTVDPLYRMAYDTVLVASAAIAAASGAGSSGSGGSSGGGSSGSSLSLAPYDLGSNAGCLLGEAWSEGKAVRAAISVLDLAGASGRLTFTSGGAVDASADGGPSLCALNLQPDPRRGAAWVELSSWAPADGLATPFERRLPDYYEQVYPGGAAEYPSDKASISGLHLKVLTKVAEPFIFIDGDNLTGYSYSGISQKIMDALSAALNFTYSFETYENITANDLVAAIAAKDYDMGISAITIRSDRWQNVSFSYPYFDLGVAFVYLDGSPAKPGLFRIFYPFSLGLWMAVLVSTVVVACLFWLYEGLTNDDFTHMPYSSFKSFGKTVYVTSALLAQQLTHKPESFEGYLLSGGWMFFAFVVAASYTAELASYLTIQKTRNVVINAGSIVSGTVPISKVAVLNGSSIESSFQRDILGCGSTGPSCTAATAGYSLCYSFDDCFQRVMDKSALVTLADSPVAEYTARNTYCNLSVDPQLIALQNYGVVLPLGSPYQDEISVAILELREAGLMDQLQAEYLADNSGTCTSDSSGSSGTVAGLAGMENMSLRELGGLFVILALFVLTSFAVYTWRSKFGKRLRRRLLGSPQPPETTSAYAVDKLNTSGNGPSPNAYQGMSRSARKRKLFELLMESYLDDQMARQREADQRRSDTRLEIERGAPRVDISGEETRRRREAAEREARERSTMGSLLSRELSYMFPSSLRRADSQATTSSEHVNGQKAVRSPLHERRIRDVSAAAAAVPAAAAPGALASVEEAKGDNGELG